MYYRISEQTDGWIDGFWVFSLTEIKKINHSKLNGTPIGANLRKISQYITFKAKSGRRTQKNTKSGTILFQIIQYTQSTSIQMSRLVEDWLCTLINR